MSDSQCNHKIDICQLMTLSYDIKNVTGVNCWGLFAMVRRQLGRAVGSYSAKNAEAAAAEFAAALATGNHGLNPIDKPSQYCLVLFRKYRRERGDLYHCGVIIDGKVLHAKGEGRTGNIWHESLSDSAVNYDEVTFWD